jgi:hypothetical protein
VIVLVSTCFWATALAASPHPPAVAAGLTGGYDYPSAQWFAGAEAVVLPRNTRGAQPLGRLIAAYGFKGLPLLTLEAGALAVVPNPEAVIRVGAVVRPTLTVSDARLPVQFADPQAGPAAGLTFGGQLWLEFEWGGNHPDPADDAPLTVGLKGGITQIPTDYFCDAVEPDFATCRVWEMGGVGSIFVRKTFPNGLSLQLEAGVIPTASVRWTFGG